MWRCVCEGRQRTACCRFSNARNKEAPQAGPRLNLVSSPFQKPGSGGARAATQIYHRTEQRQIPRRVLNAVAFPPQISPRYQRCLDMAAALPCEVNETRMHCRPPQRRLSFNGDPTACKASTVHEWTTWRDAPVPSPTPSQLQSAPASTCVAHPPNELSSPTDTLID